MKTRSMDLTAAHRALPSEQILTSFQYHRDPHDRMCVCVCVCVCGGGGGGGGGQRNGGSLPLKLQIIRRGEGYIEKENGHPGDEYK